MTMQRRESGHLAYTLTRTGSSCDTRLLRLTHRLSFHPNLLSNRHAESAPVPRDITARRASGRRAITKLAICRSVPHSRPGRTAARTGPSPSRPDSSTGRLGRASTACRRGRRLRERPGGRVQVRPGVADQCNHRSPRNACQSGGRADGRRSVGAAVPPDRAACRLGLAERAPGRPGLADQLGDL